MASSYSSMIESLHRQNGEGFVRDPQARGRDSKGEDGRDGRLVPVDKTAAQTAKTIAYDNIANFNIKTHSQLRKPTQAVRVQVDRQ